MFAKLILAACLLLPTPGYRARRCELCGGVGWIFPARFLNWFPSPCRCVFCNGGGLAAPSRWRTDAETREYLHGEAF